MNKKRLLTISAIFILIGVVLFFFYYKKDINKHSSINKSDIPFELTDEQLKDQIGQMIMIGFRGTEATEESDITKIIKEVKVGAIILSDYDVSSKSRPRNIENFIQTKQLISGLQRYSTTPLFVAIDVEGGNVNRLKSSYGFLEIVSPEEMGKDKTLETVKKESTKIALELKALGFNMNLAPVVDLNINPNNSIIGALGRSFSSDKEEVVNQARVFIENHIKNNIITVAKHFPGHGSSTTDSHLGMVDVTNTYKEEELYPYRKLNEEGLLSAVMTAHIINKNIDSDYPATLSAKFLDGILRNDIGFKGVIISDDIQMGAISGNYSFKDSIIMAINAGCDIVNVYNNNSLGYDKDLAYKTRDIIFDAVKDGTIKKERISESYNRIINLKKTFKIISSNEASTEEEINQIKNKKFELLGGVDSISFSEALDIAKYVSGITGIRPAFLLGIIKQELSLEQFDMCYLTDPKTGNGANAITGVSTTRVMNPIRDVPQFLVIAKELGKDPSKIMVTCPMSFGWGGAMGPADFIPSTWIKYKDKIEVVTGEKADPWKVRDAFLAAGMYLSDSGAKSQNIQGEWNSAMIYFSDSINSPYTWYANGAISLAEEIQKDIEKIEK